MMSQQSPCSINKVVVLKDSIVDFLKQPNTDENDSSSTDKQIQGGVLSDINYSWLSAGARLEVLHTKSGSKVAAWTFGAVLRDFQTRIACVTDLPNAPGDGRPPLLVVGLECELTGGMVCVFDICSSRVLRAIQIDEKVTSVHVVNVGCDSSVPGALRALDGVLAIGTAKGNIFIVDLCRQACDDALTNNNGSECVKDEINSCQLMPVSVQDLKHLDRHKEIALKTGHHLSLQLNESATIGAHFALKGPKGEDRLHAAKHEVTISSLLYCHQLGSLLVGYNFGAFQLYNLLTIRLEYTSPVYEDCIPVTHFAIQEPCEDPRAFCYVWVMYSGQENDEPGFPVAVMYALAYNTKDYLDDYGHLYQELVSCSVRFQTDLVALPGTSISNATGGRCVSLRSHTRGIVNKQCTSLQDVHEENLAVCVVVWTVWDANGARETVMCLFDLNQWYKEQMPSTPRIDDCASYMVHVSLTALLHPASNCNSDLLDARLDATSINQFICAQRLEEHYFPSALAFQCICVRQEDMIWFGSLGVQRHLLSCIEQAGPLCLLRPSDIFQQCITLGLTPLYTDVAYNLNTPVPIQREMILNIALEHQLIFWLCRCAQQWSNGSQSSVGCTLDFLLNWAWQRANTLKFNANKLCNSLFDYSGLRLDANALIQLNHCACQLKHICTLFGTVQSDCTTFLSKEDVSDIQYQWKALQMISVYLEVLQWLLNVGLLPECPLSMYPRPDEAERISAPYPAESLARYYQCRRSKLYELRTNDTCDSNQQSCDLLFIDNLIDLECGGQSLRKQWESDGGTGLYPPPSLQALLRTYLIEDIDIMHKHCLFIYLFLDLAMSLDQSRYKPIITHLIKFPAVFRLTPSIIKITQAFWQLDHGDFSTAMAQLLDPSVNCEDLKPWHHRTVLRSLLIQGQYQHALLYQQVRKPPVTNLQDICIIVTLFIVNDMLPDAFHFQRQNRTVYNEKELLKHFFEVCEKTNQLFAILQLPLCETEESEFVKFLKANPNDDDTNLLVVYYLQRDRYIDAFGVNDHINGDQIIRQGLLGQRERQFRNKIIDGFKKTLPVVTQNLMAFCKENKTVQCKKVLRPTPMSVFVHDTNEQAKYKSTLIEASLRKVKETWMGENQANLNETPFISTPKASMTNVIRGTTPIIYPSIKYSKDISKLAEDRDEATPAKRMKLSPRQSVRSAAERTEFFDKFCKQLSYYDSVSLLDTPIVKRKSYRSVSTADVLSDFGIGTPPSILKVRSLLRNSESPDRNELVRGTSTTPDLLDDSSIDGVVPFDKSLIANICKSTSLNVVGTVPRRKLSMVVTPRKPLQRTPRPAVHFEKMEVEVPIHVESSEKSAVIDSTNSSRSTEDQFFSPNTSFSDSNITNISVDVVNDDTKQRKPVKRKAADSSCVKSRRSYKPNRAAPDVIPQIAPSNKEVEIVTKAALEIPTPRNSEKFPKIAGRRSLTRQVLEQNTIAKAFTSTTPRMQTRLSIAKLSSESKTVAVSYSKSNTSTTVKETMIDKDKIEKIVDKYAYDVKNVFTSEKDPISSAQIIKHVHNEQSSKSMVKSVTEVVGVKELEPEPILTNDSDVDDSFIKHFIHNKTPSRYSDFSLPESQNSSIFIEAEEPEDENLDLNVALDPMQNNDKLKSPDTSLFEDIPSLVESSVTENDTTQENDDGSAEEENAVEQMEVEIVIAPKDGPVMELENISAPFESAESSFTSCIIKDVALVQADIYEFRTEPQVIDENDQLDFEVEEESDREELILDQDDEDEKLEMLEEEQDNEELILDEDDDEENHVNILSNRSSELDEEEEIDIQNTQGNDEASSEEDKLSDESDSSHDSEEKLSDEENKEEEVEQEEVEQEVLEEDVEQEVLEEEVEQEELEEEVEQEEESNEDNSSRSSDVIEIPSTSDENSNENADAPEMELGQCIKDDNLDECEIELEEIMDEQSLDTEEAQVEMEENQELTSECKFIAEVSKETEIHEAQDEDNNVLERNITYISANKEDEHIEAIEEELELQESQVEATNLLNKNIHTSSEVNEDMLSECSTVIVNPEEKHDTEIEKEITTRSSSKESIHTGTNRKKARTLSSNVEEQPIDNEASKKSAMRAVNRKRSASVDEETSKRNTRASSVITNLPAFEEEKHSIRKRRAASVDIENLKTMTSKPVIVDEPKTIRKRGKSKSVQSDVSTEQADIKPKTGLDVIPEKIEEYSATHRMTRRQRQIMVKSMELQEMKKLEAESGRGPKMGQLDPINLLDKASFTGEPDLEERYHHRSTSPASSVDTQSSVATRTSARLRNKQLQLSPELEYVESAPTTPKRKRGRPSLSGSPAPSEDRSPGNEPGSSSKPRRKSFTLAQQVITTPTRARRSRRVNSQDTDISDVSSVMSVPVVQLQRLSDKEMMQRHRSLSPTLLQEDITSSSPSARRKSTRTSILPLRTDLTKISEENSTVTETTTRGTQEIEVSQRKRGRPKKAKKSSQSGGEWYSTRSVRPSTSKHYLEQIAPKHTVLNRRKTFKLKRFTQNSTNK